MTESDPGDRSASAGWTTRRPPRSPMPPSPTRERDPFCEPVGKVGEDDHHAELQGRRLPQVDVLQHVDGNRQGKGPKDPYGRSREATKPRPSRQKGQTLDTEIWERLKVTREASVMADFFLSWEDSCFKEGNLTEY